MNPPSRRSSRSSGSGESNADIEHEVQLDEQTSRPSLSEFAIQKHENDEASTSGTENGSSFLLLPATRTHAAFVSKLYNMVEDPEIQHLICWSPHGDIFSVSNPTTFSKHVLPRYFKHNNWQSFVRQLNMYGFNKVNDMIHSNLRSENQTWEFRHPQFRKGAIEDLQKIKRKSVKGNNRPPSQTVPAMPSMPLESEEKTVDTLPKEYTVLEEKLVDMSRAFNSLHDEMSFLRTTLMRQQDLMEDIVTFMTTLQDDLKTKGQAEKKLDLVQQQLLRLKETSVASNAVRNLRAGHWNGAYLPVSPKLKREPLARNPSIERSASATSSLDDRLPPIESINLSTPDEVSQLPRPRHSSHYTSDSRLSESSRSPSYNSSNSSHMDQPRVETHTLRTKAKLGMMDMGKQSPLMNPELPSDTEREVKRRRQSP